MVNSFETIRRFVGKAFFEPQIFTARSEQNEAMYKNFLEAYNNSTKKQAALHRYFEAKRDLDDLLFRRDRRIAGFLVTELGLATGAILIIMSRYIP